MGPLVVPQIQFPIIGRYVKSAQNKKAHANAQAKYLTLNGGNMTDPSTRRKCYDSLAP